MARRLEVGQRRRAARALPPAASIAEIERFEVERQCARYLGALTAARASTAALDAAREHARQAAALERKAAATREEAADLHAPAAAELDRIRSLETDWRIAREKLAVGLAVEVALERGRTAEVSIDGQSRQIRIDAGEPAALEAKRELRLDLAGIGVVHVRGGGRDLLREAAAAEKRWNGAAKPVLARAGCATLSELEALRTRADGLLETVSGLERQAEQDRARAENLDDLERRAVVAKADVEQRRAALAEGLNPGESVEEHVSGRDEQPRDETFLEQSIARLEAEVREREEFHQQLELAVAGEEREVASRRRDLADKRAEQRKAQDAGDWRQVLAGAGAESDRLRREIEAVDAELAEIKVEATTEVEQARLALADLDGEENRARETQHETTERWTAARDELARLKGEAAELRATTQDEDIDAVRVLRDRRRVDLDALPAPSIEVDPERLAGAKDAATAAAADVRQLEMQLRAAEGALEQVGGQYIQERAQQAREAVVALEEREHELDLDYGAWRLLQEALIEAEQEEAVHLGKALVQPVSERVAALTGGRYGQVAIGPQLDAAGIQTAGGERKFDILSVGTQEQIALLLRLSIAEALEAFIVLDDQLTQSDPERMTWMRDLLEAAASRIQVVVMTCHPEHYAVENGRGHVVDLSSCVRRRTVAATQGIGR